MVEWPQQDGYKGPKNPAVAPFGSSQLSCWALVPVAHLLVYLGDLSPGDMVHIGQVHDIPGDKSPQYAQR